MSGTPSPRFDPHDRARGWIETVGGLRPFFFARSGGSVWVHLDGRAHHITPPCGNAEGRRQQLAARAGDAVAGPLASLRAPMPGVVLAVLVTEGAPVARGDALLTIEAMKMEYELRAPHDGTVANLSAAEGLRVRKDDLLLELEP